MESSDSRKKRGVLVGYCKADAYRDLTLPYPKIVESKDLTFTEYVEVTWKQKRVI